ncbi:phospholipase D-like domain-containing protein [Streptomyces zaomyceticus]|uniref:phospholipase D-like domain-containing protein n=1 Tax=Streptomyces zaomyceticus TaxID=68286 RepID=UPI003713E25F
MRGCGGGRGRGCRGGGVPRRRRGRRGGRGSCRIRGPSGRGSSGDPVDRGRSRQHAKFAVADRRTLLLGSANQTESGARRNMEAGVLVTGGEAPRRAAEHIRELQRRAILKPFPPHQAPR